MKNVVVFGYGYTGTIVAKELYRNPEYMFMGFVDNSVFKQGYYAYDYPIRSFDDLIEMNRDIDLSVVIACKDYYMEMIEQCEENGIVIEGVFEDGRIKKYPFASFDTIKLDGSSKLYAGDIMDDVHLSDPNLFGLSITKNDDKHIFHDITNSYPLPDNCIASYEAECVLELINPDKLVFAINEIYRILVKGGWLRITVPDHYSPYLKRRAMRDGNGKVIYDAGETYAVKYGKNGLEGGWTRFTNYDSFKEILDMTKFEDFDWLCFHSKDGILHKKTIDLSKGYNKRISNDENPDEYNILVDCYK